MRLAIAVALLVAAASAPLVAQARAQLELQLPPLPQLATDGPDVRGLGIVSDGEMRDLLRSGFPARLHYRVELWSAGGWFNDLKGTTEWDVVLRYDPLDRNYRAYRVEGTRVVLLGVADQFPDVQATIERPFRAPIAPPRKGARYYYNVALDVETLSMSDLDEVERWLRGELKPAVRGQRNPGTALTRGLRTLFVRLLGGEKRHYEKRSATFEVR